ncbi:MAG: hypothetical protein PUB00_09715 [Clostridiales bacterium]|nr:hypothetical protein [Clostridiales bacterium]
MEKKRNEQQNMDDLIQKYKEEAMRYRQRYSDLYPEQIPAKEVSANPTQPSEENTTEKETSESNTDLPAEAPVENPAAEPGEAQLMPNSVPEQAEQPITPESTVSDDQITGPGDTFYARTPEEIKEIISKSPSESNEIEYTDTGWLQVQASAANEAIPIESAIVLVLRKADNATNLIWNLQTDTSGNTPRVELPAPPENLSEQPEPVTVIAYGVYLVIASHPDYYTTIVNDVQIFAGQTAILPIAFIPLSEKDINPSAPNNEFDTEKHSLLE